MSVVLIIGGAQLIFIGLIGEYLARTYEASKQRPLYIVRERIRASAAASSAVDREVHS